MGARYDVELQEHFQLPTMDVQVRQLTAALRAQRKRLATFVPQLYHNVFQNRLLDVKFLCEPTVLALSRDRRPKDSNRSRRRARSSAVHDIAIFPTKKVPRSSILRTVVDGLANPREIHRKGSQNVQTGELVYLG
jgi:hypothetical protein